MKREGLEASLDGRAGVGPRKQNFASEQRFRFRELIRSNPKNIRVYLLRGAPVDIGAKTAMRRQLLPCEDCVPHGS